MTGITTYQRQPDGTATIGVDLGDSRPRVLITPRGTDPDAAQRDADTLARTIVQADMEIQRLRRAASDAEERADRATATANRNWSMCRDMEDRLRAACGERTGVARGDFYARHDNGPVWLLGNLEKGWSAFGLRFQSWEDLARARPELRPVGCGQDETGSYVVLREVALTTDRAG